MVGVVAGQGTVVASDPHLRDIRQRTIVGLGEANSLAGLLLEDAFMTGLTRRLPDGGSAHVQNRRHHGFANPFAWFGLVGRDRPPEDVDDDLPPAELVPGASAGRA